MDNIKFIELLIEELELEDTTLEINTDLTGLDEYDSLAVMTIIALADEHFDVKLTAVQLKSITSVKSLQELIGIEKFA